MRTDRKDKEEESERDGFDETHIVVRLEQAIVLDLRGVFSSSSSFVLVFCFRQCFALTLSSVLLIV